MDRREFLFRGSAAGLMLFPAGRLLGCSLPPAYRLPLGVCTELKNAAMLLDAGYEYVEESVGRFLMPGNGPEEFDKMMGMLAASPLPVYACNSFIPGDLRSVGPDVDQARVMAWVETAITRAGRAGLKAIVLGSGASRFIPEGFPRDKAEQQFRELLGSIGPLAKKQNLFIAIEHLNSSETNHINTLTEGLGLIERVNHSNIRLLCDIYHMLRENEGPEAILKAGNKIVHCHIAENKDRAAPGTHGEDFTPYLHALKQSGYKGRMSVECRWSDFENQVKPVYNYLAGQFEALDE